MSDKQQQTCMEFGCKTMCTPKRVVIETCFCITHENQQGFVMCEKCKAYIWPGQTPSKVFQQLTDHMLCRPCIAEYIDKSLDDFVKKPSSSAPVLSVASIGFVWGATKSKIKLIDAGLNRDYDWSVQPRIYIEIEFTNCQCIRDIQMQIENAIKWISKDSDTTTSFELMSSDLDKACRVLNRGIKEIRVYPTRDFDISGSETLFDLNKSRFKMYFIIVCF